MKALSIKQPWAYYIAQGIKTKEIRSWTTKYRGDIIVCSSLKPNEGFKKTSKLIDKKHLLIGRDFEEYLHFGYSICVVELYDIKPMKRRDVKDSLVSYSPDLYSWYFRNIRPVINVPIKGQLGLFNVDLHIE